MGQDVVKYTYQNATLTLYPRAQMTWRVWTQASFAMAHVVGGDVNWKFQFFVLKDGFVGELAWGALTVG